MALGRTLLEKTTRRQAERDGAMWDGSFDGGDNCQFVFESGSVMRETRESQKKIWWEFLMKDLSKQKRTVFISKQTLEQTLEHYRSVTMNEHILGLPPWLYS